MKASDDRPERPPAAQAIVVERSNAATLVKSIADVFFHVAYFSLLVVHCLVKWFVAACCLAAAVLDPLLCRYG